mmetsp:Transcript_2919/g.5536  ORF Transcript_2919/g.5536 Transcript_2919/m.5536 type:complete len:168 (+) Transcript_2919:6047-6550(+)
MEKPAKKTKIIDDEPGMWNENYKEPTPATMNRLTKQPARKAKLIDDEPGMLDESCKETRPASMDPSTKQPAKKTKILVDKPKVLTEKWNVKRLKELVYQPWAFKTQSKLTKVSNIYEQIVDKSRDKNGFAELQVQYYPSEFNKAGRLFGKGFQGVPAFVKRLCCPAS